MLPFRTTLETDLKIEREWRGTLQKNLEQEKEKVAKLQINVQHLQELRRVKYIHLFNDVVFYNKN